MISKPKVQEKKEEFVTWQWVKTRYNGDLAKNAIGLANEAIGYHILEVGKEAGTTYAVVAFKWADRNGAMPYHVAPLNNFEFKKVEQMEKKRYGKR